MKVVRNIGEDVKFTSPMIACSVLVTAWRYECRLAEEIACSILQYYLQLMTKKSMRVSILSSNVGELRLVQRSLPLKSVHCMSLIPSSNDYMTLYGICFEIIARLGNDR
jgi:hypothetical protein